MWLYILIFLSAVLLCLVAKSLGMQHNKAILTLSMVGLALFVGLSDMLGGFDRYIYGQMFDSMADQVTNGNYSIAGSDVAELYHHEYGYQAYNLILALITRNRYTFIIITTFIIYLLLYKSIKRYCNDYPFAIIIFMGLWFFFSFTYLRQVMGATLAWLSIQYILKRDLKKFLLVMAVAVSFHNSAIIFIPLYWIPIRKFSKTTIYNLLVIALIIGASGASSALFNAYGEIDQGRAQTVNDEAGFRVAYLIEAMFLLYIIIKKYKDIPDKPVNIVMFNMAVVFCGILLFFIRNANAGRLSWYYMIGIISTITYICTNNKRNRSLANMMIVLCFFLYYRILVTWGFMIYPYKSMLTNGVRQNDPIEIEYEYDHGYDHDKFYRPAFRFMSK